MTYQEILEEIRKLPHTPALQFLLDAVTIQEKALEGPSTPLETRRHLKVLAQTFNLQAMRDAAYGPPATNHPAPIVVTFEGDGVELFEKCIEPN